MCCRGEPCVRPDKEWKGEHEGEHKVRPYNACPTLHRSSINGSPLTGIEEIPCGCPPVFNFQSSILNLYSRSNRIGLIGFLVYNVDVRLEKTCTKSSCYAVRTDPSGANIHRCPSFVCKVRPRDRFPEPPAHRPRSNLFRRQVCRGKLGRPAIRSIDRKACMNGIRPTCLSLHPTPKSSPLQSPCCDWGPITHFAPFCLQMELSWTVH